MAKICLIYKSAPHYREPIFLLMDREMDVDWHFGSFSDPTGLIEQLDTSRLQRVRRHHTLMVGPWYWMWGYLPLLFRRDYRSFLALGETRDLSLCAFLLLKRLLFPAKRVYLWTHGFYGKESRFQRLLKRWMFGMADGNFTYSQHSKDIMVSLGFHADRIWPIHNSLNHDAQLALRHRLQPSEVYRRHFGNSLHNLIFIGRLTQVKRLDLLLQALCRLPDCNLTLIGDGPEREHLLSLSVQLGLQPRVWFFGACYDEATNAEMIYNADLCVAPGNVGLTAMHTLVFGCPVATHDSFEWQMPEFEAVQEGRTGTFFHYQDVESMARQIALWLSHSDRESVRQACYEEIDNRWTPRYQVEILKSHLL